MDRLTPFRAEQVFWTCLAGMRDTVRRRLHVRLTLVPRGRVEPVLAALRLAGLVPLRIEAGTAGTASHTTCSVYPNSFLYSSSTIRSRGSPVPTRRRYQISFP